MLTVLEVVGTIGILLGLCAVPIGLIIWVVRALKKKKTRMGWGTALVGVAIFVFSLMMFGIATELAPTLESNDAAQLAPPPESKETATPDMQLTATSTNTPEPMATSTPIPIVDITPQEVKEVNVDGTEYQWGQLKQEMMEKRIIWHGTISDVEEDRTVRISFPGTSIYISAGPVSEERAAELTKGEPVTLEALVVDLSKGIFGSARVEVKTIQLEF